MTTNEAAGRTHGDRADWRVEQDAAYLLRVDKADGRLDSLGRSEFNDLLSRALEEERRATVERIRERIYNADPPVEGAGQFFVRVREVLEEEAAR